MKKTYLAITFIFLATFCAAQKNDSITNNNCLSVKYDIVRLLPDVFGMKYGCICLGIEYNFNKKNSVGIDLGYITDYEETKENGIGNISAKSVKGYYSNIEFRHYYKSTNRYNFYYGINFLYQNTKTEREEIIIHSSNYLNVTTSKNIYFVNREVYASHIMSGIKIQFSHFVLDPEIGFGLRYIKSATENLKGSPDHTYELPYNKAYDAGEKLFPGFNYNLKVGWLF